MLYEIVDGTVTSGGEPVLSHIHFEIKGTEKIGIVGRNGAGKTTLLRLIAGEITADRDDKRKGPVIRTSRAVTFGMLEQTREKDRDKTIDELILEGWASEGPEETREEEYCRYRTEYDRIFTGFGFSREDKSRRLAGFSGGEQTRIALIRLLLQKPDILLLDEPTNHLDLKALAWLEDYMRSYKSAVVFVSHDRYFLDQVVDVIYEVRGGRLYRYPGDYTHFRLQKQKDQAAAEKAYESQQKEIARLDELIRKFRTKPRKAAFARSRKTILERMERLEKPEKDVRMFTGELVPRVRPGKWILELKELKAGYEECLLDISLRVRSGQKIGIIGENGAGKTTLLRTIAGLMSPLGGECRLHERTVTGYFDQQTAQLDADVPVVEHFHALFPAMTEKEVRQTLAMYLFGGRAAQVRVKDLSGGEKARLVLAEILTGLPNLLLLDEPTNHMDIPAKEVLESAFKAYQGTILFVSHDRYFIREVADAVLVLDGREAFYYPFGYEHYIEQKEKGSGEVKRALLRAEDQALLEGMRAVPEKERHRLREYSTQELTHDWRLQLAMEDMEAAREKYFLLLEEWERRKEDEVRLWAEGAETSVEEELFEGVRSAEDAWTESCIAIFLETC